ncbi:MAG: cytochrome P460 family protein [Burkholderiales bacterium]|nr:cytochrome P460 family protein [Burkholderiales bacterium]
MKQQQAHASGNPLRVGATLAIPLAAFAAGLVAAGGAAAQATTANVEAGKARAQTVCAACHGANGVSIADNIPNLAGQRVAYIENQLRAFKAGTRKQASMNAIAAQLAPADITDVAAYFGSLVPTNVAQKSEQLPQLQKTQVAFPEGYRSSFQMYQTVNRADINQVRYLYANAVAWQAAREGKPLPAGSVLLLEQWAAKLDADKKPVVGAGGFYVPDRLVNYAVMSSGAGWGAGFPEMLRNGDWNYAVFAPDMKIRAGANQADCLACHKPLDKANYVFSNEPLMTAAKR